MFSLDTVQGFRRIVGEPTATVQGKPAAWRLVSDGSCYDDFGTVDLRKVFGPEHNVYAYAVTWLVAEAPPSGNSLRHRSFSFQSDDMQQDQDNDNNYG